MTDAADSLPEDVPTLQAMLLTERAARLAAESEAKSRALQIEQLKYTIAKLRHQQFGQSSERGAILEQLELQLSELQADASEAAAAAQLAAERAKVAVQGFDGLALLVQETLKRNPHNGHLFVFRGRRGGLLKVLWHDGQGMCLFAKRLERGRFVWPSTIPRDNADRSVTITPAQLGYLLEGIDWRMPQRTWRPQAAG